MDKNIKITMLYDIYGKLLTVKQQEIFVEYYLYNLSLREIAENKKISYQAVRDSIKTSENMLFTFESKIGMYNLLEKTEKVVELCVKNDDVNLVKDEIISLLKDSNS